MRLRALKRDVCRPDAPDSTAHDHIGTVLAQYWHENDAKLAAFFTHMSRRMLYTTGRLYAGQLDAAGSGNAPIRCAASWMQAGSAWKRSAPGWSNSSTSRKAMPPHSEACAFVSTPVRPPIPYAYAGGMIAMSDTGSDSGRIRRLLRAVMPVTPPPPQNLRSIPCLRQSPAGRGRRGMTRVRRHSPLLLLAAAITLAAAIAVAAAFALSPRPASAQNADTDIYTDSVP